MTATEKRLDAQPGGQLGAGRQTAWWATESEVDMAAALAGTGSGYDCLRAAKCNGRSDAHRGHRHRHAE